jgi:hypothetical protein
MAAETSDFDRLLQLPQVPPGRRPLSPRMVWPHLRALQPEEEAPLQTRCRSSGPSYIGQPQAVDRPARLLAPRTGGGNSILGPLGDQAPLEMRDRSEDTKNQLAGGRVRVDPFLQAEQGNAALLSMATVVSNFSSCFAARQMAAAECLRANGRHAGSGYETGACASSRWSISPTCTAPRWIACHHRRVADFKSEWPRSNRNQWPPLGIPGRFAGPTRGRHQRSRYGHGEDKGRPRAPGNHLILSSSQ